MGLYVVLHNIAICIFFLIFTGFLYFTNASEFLNYLAKDRDGSGWVLGLLRNCAFYSIVIVPGFLFVQYVQTVDHAGRREKGFLWPLIRFCVYGRCPRELQNNSELQIEAHLQPKLSYINSVFMLVFCFFGLQGCYLTWGLLQEKIMTQDYNGVKFSDSQFLVFANRLFGFGVALVYNCVYDRQGSQPPLFKYSFCALSNILSSWLQYEALKFVSFPTQVLAKTSKIIPVMLMGKLISRKTFKPYEYYTALLISGGMTLFLTSSKEQFDFSESSIDVAGLVTLTLYMTFDSFTSNWQDQLFQAYKTSPFQMMMGVNLCSLILMAASVLRPGTIFRNVEFIVQHRDFGIDCLALSICSAVGQLFIYKTIEQFGPVVFTIIMTVRQVAAILLSCIFFHHSIPNFGILGVALVFFSLFVRIYCSFGRNNSNKRKHEK